MSAFTAMSAIAHDWAVRCFGKQVVNIPLRSLRLTEEAVELCHSLKVPEETMHLLVKLVYQKERGKLEQELGGVLLTAAVMCHQLGVPMETYFRVELQRVLDKPVKHFADRNLRKEEMGLNA